MNERTEMSPGPSATPIQRREVPADVVMQWLAAELSDLASDLDRFQHDLSGTLQDAHVSPELMNRLQSLDAATQTLSALSHVASALEHSAGSSAEGVCMESLQELVKLGDLRSRLTGTGQALNNRKLDAESGHVSLF